MMVEETSSFLKRLSLAAMSAALSVVRLGMYPGLRPFGPWQAKQPLARLRALSRVMTAALPDGVDPCAASDSSNACCDSDGVSQPASAAATVQTPKIIRLSCMRRVSYSFPMVPYNSKYPPLVTGARVPANCTIASATRCGGMPTRWPEY